MQEKGQVKFPLGGTEYFIKKQYIDDARENNDIGSIEKIPVEFPVTILHGKKDLTIPWKVGSALSQKIVSPEVKLVLLRDGSHRLNEDLSQKVYMRELKSLVGKVPDTMDGPKPKLAEQKLDETTPLIGKDSNLQNGESVGGGEVPVQNVGLATQFGLISGLVLVMWGY